MTQDVTHVLASFVVRNSSLSHEEFSEHYEAHHGPLAAALSSFRMYVSRYVQNHVVERLSATAAEIDGVTMLTQRPRDDYATGFFQHPDFAAHILPDSQYLFDIPSNRALLGIQHTPKSRLGPNKLLLLTSANSVNLVLGLLVADANQVTEFGALGETPAAIFGHDRLIEAWFASPAALLVGWGKVKQSVAEPVSAWCVREVLIYDESTIEDTE